MNSRIKVVIDTNVLVSALWSDNGNPVAILQLIPQTIVPYFNNEIFIEYIDVLNRPKFDFSSHKKTELLYRIEKYGEMIATEKSDIPMVDEADRKFYDAARASGAILITGNIKHYPAEKFIMTAKGFLEMEKSSR